MSRPQKGARLWLRPERVVGKRTRPANWIIKDGGEQISTGCGALERAEAEKALADYIARKHEPARDGARHPSQIAIADVLAIYAEDVAPRHARPHETGARLEKLLAYFGDKPLSFINGTACRAYAKHRKSQSAARRELEDLRSAIKHHRKEGYCSEIVEVVLPEKSLPRERWLTRSEAAALLWAAWRARQIDANRDGGLTKRPVGKHVARFILVGLYTGTRAGAICGASLDRLDGRGFIDLEAGVFYRRAQGKRETKKRQPPAPIPPRLLAHLRRWARLGLCKSAVVEWGGQPVGRVTKAFSKAAAVAGLEGVTPHTLRHTAATWLMQNGVDLWQAGGFLGMTPQMLEERYGHHHPAHLQDAAAAISGKGRPPIGHRNYGTTMEHSATQRNGRH